MTLHSTVVQAKDLPAPVSADPDDDKFIAAALAHRCRLIVSGDRHLLDVTGHRKIRVLRPREFVVEFLGA